MTTISLTRFARDVWRKYAVDGVPASGKNEPDKTEIIAWGEQLEALMQGFQAGGGVIFGSKAGADANLAFNTYTMAWVVLDTTAANNGVYQKYGANGGGGWSKFANLPYSFYRATNTGAGTANAIRANNSYPIASTDSLIVFDILVANTSSAVTVAFNGGTAYPIKTISGSNPAIGALTVNMIVAGYITPSNEFRMISDESSAAIQAAAQAAQTAAEAARDLAIAAANLAATTNGGDVPFPTRTLAAASTIGAAKKYVIVEGYAAAGDAPAIMYKRVTSQPSHALKFRSVDRFMPDGSTDATNGGWWEAALDEPGLVLMPNHFGAPNDGSSYDDTALTAMAVVMSLGRCRRAKFKGAFKIWQTATIAVATGSAFAVSGVDGMTFEFQNAVFTTNAGQLDLVTGVNWAGYVFNFTDCKNFRGIGRPKFVGDLTFVAMQAYGSAHGTIGLSFTDNCSGLTLDGVEGSGILTPFNMVCDNSRVMASCKRPIVAVAGTGYAIGNVLSATGGGGSTAATFAVDAIDGSGGIKGLAPTGLGDFPEGTLPTITGASNGYPLSGGGGTGARAYIYLQRATEDDHTAGGSAGYVKARNCFYCYVQRDSGDYMTAQVDAEFCYRSTFVYGGIVGARIHTRMRHIYSTALIYGSAFHGLGNKDCYFHVRMPEASIPSSSNGLAITRCSLTTPLPTEVSVHLDLDLEYGTLTNRAASFGAVNKYDAGLTDNNPRGHSFQLRVTGRINGKSDFASESSGVGTHFTMSGVSGWIGEFFGGWEFGPLTIEGGGDIIIDPNAFPNIGLPTDPTFVNTKCGIYFDVVNPDGNVVFNNSLGGSDYKDGTKSRAAITVSGRSLFKNRFGASTVGAATIGAIETNSDITLLPGWQNFTIKNAENGTGGNILRNLPASPIKGQRYTVMNTANNSTRVRIVPPSPFNFAGQAATKYLELGVYSSATVECIAAAAQGDSSNVWVVESSYGTLTYQP